jgi:hypothetical protein
MLKKLVLKISVLAMMLMMMSADSLAQTRVRFQRGRNSATVRGSVGASGGSRSYVLRAMRGQTITATLSSGNGKVDFMQGSRHDTQYSRVLDSTGDVYIDIDNHGGRATTYTLTISIQ